MLGVIKSRLQVFKNIQVWFHPKYIPEIKIMTASERYSLKRSKKILSTLRHQLLLFSRDLKQAPLVSWETLATFHDPEYLAQTTQHSKAFLPLGMEPGGD